jgi:uncharacterized protein (TIGR02646 family)
MRPIPPRQSLPTKVVAKLKAKTTSIVGHQDPVKHAATLWESSRGTAWFENVINALAAMSGLGQRCMYCSGSESAQVEHYEPKSATPSRTFVWDNHLWVCGICNNIKGNRFSAPAPFPPGVFPIDPTSENPWDHFFIDQYGNLSAKWDTMANAQDARALWTIELMGLDRQALQESRQARLDALKQSIDDTLELHISGKLDIENVKSRLQTWPNEPSQPDIAAYFLAGPGANDAHGRFREILDLVIHDNVTEDL